MSQVMLISNVDKDLVIPPKMRGLFPNETTLRIHLPAGVPTPVPDYVGEYFVKNWAKKFRIEGMPIPEEPEIPAVQESPKIKFDPIEFVQTHYQNIGEPLKDLKRLDLFAVAKTMGLTHYNKDSDDEIRRRIVHDVKVQNEQEKELEKHKEAK